MTPAQELKELRAIVKMICENANVLGQLSQNEFARIELAHQNINKAENRPRGRKQATGRYETRQELVEATWRLYDLPDTSQADVAKATGVSARTTATILSEPRP